MTAEHPRKPYATALASTREAFAWCLAIRFQTFVLEQGIPSSLEIDGEEDVARHFLGRLAGEPVATGRWRDYGTGPQGRVAKIERVAVLAGARGRGLGVALMADLIADIRAAGGYGSAKLSSQDHAIGFYERLGFRVEGEGYLDAGIPHHDMWLRAL